MMDQLEVAQAIQIDRLRRQVEEARRLLWLLLPHVNVVATERAEALQWLRQFEWTKGDK